MPRCLRVASIDLCVGGAPAAEDIHKLCTSSNNKPLALHNYPNYSQSDAASPRGFRINHLQSVIGRGDNAYRQAARALATGEALELPWVRFWRRGNGHRWQRGDIVVIAARHAPFIWTSNVNKTVRVQHRSNFTSVTWGTTSRHVLNGEETLQVWREPSGDVIFRLRSFSRPHALIAWLMYPIVCYFQRRFAVCVCNKLYDIAKDNIENQRQLPRPVERGKLIRENLRGRSRLDTNP